MRSLKKPLVIPASNAHDGPCGVYSKCQACKDAAHVAVDMPAVHAALVAHYSSADAPIKAKKRKKRAKAAASTRKPAKQTRTVRKDTRRAWVRKDSTLDKLGVKPRVVKLLGSLGYQTVGDVTALTEAEVRTSLSAMATRKLVEALDKYGKKLAA